MPDIASVLKAEVLRLARKEVKAQTEGLRKSLAAARADVASLRKRMQELERASKQARRARAPSSRPTATEDASNEPDSSLRFRAAGMAANRKRLGLSAADFGRLIGVTGQTVYSWESGKGKPKGAQLSAVAALRGIGKREVAERLASLTG